MEGCTGAHQRSSPGAGEIPMWQVLRGWMGSWLLFSAGKDVLWLEQQAVQVASLLQWCSRCVGTMYTQNSTHLCPLIYLHTSRATVSAALRIQHRALCHSTLCVSPHLMMALLGAHFSLHSFIGTFTQGHSHATSDPSITISDVIFLQLFILHFYLLYTLLWSQASLISPVSPSPSC